MENESNNQLQVVTSEDHSIGRAMSVTELKSQLDFIRTVMQTVMQEGQDYGKIPGCGEKPTLLQPGAQKLCMTFHLTNDVKEERVVDLPNFHREYSFVIRLTSAAGRMWEGVGTCSTMESKYRFRKAERKCPKCGKSAIIQGKVEYGGGWVCFKKKDGCGAKFDDNDPSITSQSGGTVEYENPPDYWNTVRKMAFKRALVHASINSTNTSELWTQDVEEMVENAQCAPAPQRPVGASGSRPPQPAVQRPNAQPAPSSVARPPASAKDVVGATPEQAAPDQRFRFLSALSAIRTEATTYFVKKGWLKEGQQLEDLPNQHVPTMKKAYDSIMAELQAFMDGDGETEEFWWKKVVVPFGAQQGTPIGELDKKKLFGWCKNYEIEESFQGVRKSDEELAVLHKFREALDAAEQNYFSKDQ